MKKLIIILQIIAIIFLLSVKPEQANTDKYYYMTATAYYPGAECCGIWADGFTYTGDIAGRGCVAIDHKAGILKLGQKLYIEGYGYGTANDIGGAIKGWKIDLCFDTLEEAKEWGVKLVKVNVLN